MSAISSKCKNCNLKPTAPLVKVQCCQSLFCKKCASLHECSILFDDHCQNICWRCSSSKALLCCQECQGVLLCSACDTKIHGKGKFSLHYRKTCETPDIQVYQEENPYKLSVKGPFLEPEMGSKHKTLVSINISQTWNQLIAEVELKFEELSNLLTEKKNQILNKLHKKRQKELKSYLDLVSELEGFNGKNVKGDSNLRKSQMLDKYDSIQKKLQTFQTDYSQGSDGKSKYAVINSHFESVKAILQKIEVRGVILKVTNQQQRTPKMKMRNSMVFGSNGSIGSGVETTFCKTQKDPKSRLSISTIEGEYREQVEKGSDDEEKMKMSSNSNRLLKVKSEKLFMKATGSLKSYFKEQLKRKAGQ